MKRQSLGLTERCHVSRPFGISLRLLTTPENKESLREARETGDEDAAEEPYESRRSKLLPYGLLSSSFHMLCRCLTGASGVNFGRWKEALIRLCVCRGSGSWITFTAWAAVAELVILAGRMARGRDDGSVGVEHKR